MAIGSPKTPCKERLLRNEHFTAIALMLVCFFTLAHFSSNCQLEHLEGAKAISINSDNDLFRLDGKESDRYYTAGHSIVFGFGAATRSKWADVILFTPFKQSHSWIDIRINQQLNTPEILSTTLTQVGDYPYAAALYATLARTTLSKSKKNRYRTEILMGTMGSLALGKEFQQSLHNVISSSYPQGWQNQLPNQFIFNYDVFFESKIVSLFKKSHLTVFGQTRVGNFYTGAQVGFNLNFFTFSNVYFDDFLLTQPSKNWRVSFSIKPSLKWVGWNSMLQGAPYAHFASDTTYRIDSSQLNRWVVCGSLSIGLAKGRHSLQLQQTYWGTEFRFSNDNNSNENTAKTLKDLLFGTLRYSLLLNRPKVH